MSAVANLPPSPLRVAVLLLAPVQLLDVSPIDLFGMLTKEYLTACGLPAPLLRGAVASRIFYVAAQPGEDAVAECTAGAGLRVTHLLSDEECSPGRVHVVLIPGPDPKMVPGEAVRAFIRGHVGSGAAVLTVCTGVFAAGYAGVLEGRRATGPRALVGGLRGKFPGVRWEDKRWVCDGNVWSSAGITNGLDMVAAYMRETWPGPTTEAVLAMADVGGRSQNYDNSKIGDDAWWLWQILRAWLGGSKRSGMVTHTGRKASAMDHVPSL